MTIDALVAEARRRQAAVHNVHRHPPLALQAETAQMATRRRRRRRRRQWQRESIGEAHAARAAHDAHTVRAVWDVWAKPLLWQKAIPPHSAVAHHGARDV